MQGQWLKFNPEEHIVIWVQLKSYEHLICCSIFYIYWTVAFSLAQQWNHAHILASSSQVDVSGGSRFFIQQKWEWKQCQSSFRMTHIMFYHVSSNCSPCFGSFLGVQTNGFLRFPMAFASFACAPRTQAEAEKAVTDMNVRCTQGPFRQPPVAVG
jgi:hypothetical protein